MFTLTIIQALQDWLTNLLGESAQATYLINAILVAFTVFMFLVLYLSVCRIFDRLSARVLKEDSQVQPLRIQKQEILSSAEVARILNIFFQIISWTLRIYILLTFINTILGLFDWSRDLSESAAARFASARRCNSRTVSTRL